jgi:hypothetical protein
MVVRGVDATWLRSHHYLPGGRWGRPDTDDDGEILGDGIDNDQDGLVDEVDVPAVDDIREAGFGGDDLQFDPMKGGALRYSNVPPPRSGQNPPSVPLFSEEIPEPSIDGARNPYMLYEPMTRLGNLVTTRSNVYAVYVTVGYFEVEPASSFVEVQKKFGGDGSATEANPTNNAANIAARALYDRVYPEGYALAQEMGSDTGDVRRERAFYIIDRSRPVGFKPGQDLNDEDTILVRRRIE